MISVTSQGFAIASNGTYYLKVGNQASSPGTYDLRVDLAALRDPAMKEIGRGINAAAEYAQASMKEAMARVQVVSQGVDEAIEAMVKLVVQGDLTGELRLGVSDAALTPLVAGVGQVMETLKKFVTEIREAALQLSTSSAEVLAGATQNESSTSQQASAPTSRRSSAFSCSSDRRVRALRTASVSFSFSMGFSR